MSVHRYECANCRIFIYGETVDRLSVDVNQHNHQHHPSDCDTWTSSQIVKSSRYRNPDVFASTARPEYTVSHGTTQNSIKTIDQKVTDADRNLLAELKVKW